MHQDRNCNPDESDVILVTSEVNQFLQLGEFNSLKDYCLDKENTVKISKNGWDLLAQIMSFLKDEKVEKENLKLFEDVFRHIASKSNPKEIFLCLLEQFDPMVELDIVELLFSAVKTCSSQLIMNNKRNQCQNLNMLFCSLIYYLDSLNLPKYATFQPSQNNEEKEEIKIALYISRCVNLEESLLGEIVEQLEENEINTDHFDKAKREFLCFSSNLLERLSHLDMDEKKKSTSGRSICRSCHDEIKEHHGNDKSGVAESDRKSNCAASELCAFLRKIEDPFQLFRVMHWTKFRTDSEVPESDEENTRFELSRAVYIYLNLLKEHELLYFPQILHPMYVFVSSIPSILILWKTVNPVHVHKGMELARLVTNRVEPNRLQCKFLNRCLQLSKVPDASLKLLHSATNIAMQCPTLVLRQRAIQFVKKFMDKFDWPDRYWLLYDLLVNSQHRGVVGYLLGYFKDKLDELLQMEAFSGSQKFFMEKNRLRRIFEISIYLPDGSDTDLLAEHDKIIASLNLLRFLFIRDINNRTGICSLVESVQQEYLDPLRTAINLSRMHFRDELQKMLKPQVTVNPSPPTMMINGISLFSLPLQDRQQALQSAVNSFDVLQSICIRVEELVDKVRSNA